jgi:hypothetical protein
MKGLRCSLSPEECNLVATEFSPPMAPYWVCYAHFLKRLTPLKGKAIQEPEQRSTTSAKDPAKEVSPTSAGKSAKAKAEARKAAMEAQRAREQAEEDEFLAMAAGDDDFASAVSNSAGRRPSAAPAALQKDSTATSSSAAPSGGTSDPPKPKEKVKDDEAWQPNRKVVERVPTELELKNQIEIIRSMGKLHRAGVADKYRYGSDLTSAGSMVLAGAGAGPNPCGKWVSEASVLTKLHNSAMRTVNPSGLDELKEPKKRRKKKGDDEDELKLSDSGLFFARYPGCERLKAIKVLRKKHFPPHDGFSDDERQRYEQLGLKSDQANAASFLGSSLKG